MATAESEGWHLVEPTNEGSNRLPSFPRRSVSPPQVRFPTNVPARARRKCHGRRSPPDPENSLMIITFGPALEPVGEIGIRI